MAVIILKIHKEISLELDSLRLISCSSIHVHYNLESNYELEYNINSIDALDNSEVLCLIIFSYSKSCFMSLLGIKTNSAIMILEC